MDSREPSEVEISQVIDFAGVDHFEYRDVVINALKNNNRDVETVVMQYFDDPVAFKSKYARAWDESMFAGSRDGTDNNAGISFHIEAANQNDIIQGVTPPPDGQGKAAPSRPPSRTDNRSPLGRVVDWTAGNNAGPSQQAQEDEDVQRALMESAQEAGITMPPNDSGVPNAPITTSNFGPANRSDYDTQQWAMVPTTASQPRQENMPAPSMRQRASGAPAFLIQGNDPPFRHRLGGLLTILHAIPLARNILLNIGSPATSYGHNSEWWKGKQILPPHILAKMQQGQLSWAEQNEARPVFEEEIHRLMAFLDDTERTFGTAGVLADLVPYPAMGIEKQFYESLDARNHDKIRPLYQTAGITYVSRDEVDEELLPFGLLEVEHVRGDYANIRTLYESLDHLMWSDVLGWCELHEESKMAFFKEMGEVLVISMGGDGPEDSIDIPLELCPERYLLGRKEEARRIQIAWAETKKTITQIKMMEQTLSKWQDGWDDRVQDKREMVQDAQKHWEIYGEYLEMRARFRAMEESGFDAEKYPDYRAAPCELNEDERAHYQSIEKLLELSEHLMRAMDSKKKALESQLEQIQEKQRFLGRLLTDPNKAGRPKPMTCKRFLLRGVATSTDVIYVCKRADEVLIELDDEPAPKDQWWRMAYLPDDGVPIQVEKVEAERVLRDMWQETKVPLFIYATEKALNTPRDPMPGPLERFVRADNKSYHQELNLEKAVAADEQTLPYQGSLSPSKRKHRSDSMDSMDSNRASIGSDDRNAFEDPFVDKPGATEMELQNLRGAGVQGNTSIDSVVHHGHSDATERANQAHYSTTTSNTMTPATVQADEGSLSPAPGGIAQDSGGEDNPSSIAGTASPPLPEMQQLSRQSTFLSGFSEKDGRKPSDSTMEMDEAK